MIEVVFTIGLLQAVWLHLWTLQLYSEARTCWDMGEEEGLKRQMSVTSGLLGEIDKLKKQISEANDRLVRMQLLVSDMIKSAHGDREATREIWHKLLPEIRMVESGHRPYIVMSEPTLRRTTSEYEYKQHRLQRFCYEVCIDLSQEARVETALAYLAERIKESVLLGISKEWTNQSLVK